MLTDWFLGDDDDETFGALTFDRITNYTHTRTYIHTSSSSSSSSLYHARKEIEEKERKLKEEENYKARL